MVEVLKLLGREPDVQRGQITLELFQSAGSQDQGGNAGLSRCPTQGDPRWRALQLRRHASQGVQRTPVTLGELPVAEGVGAAQPSLARRRALACPLIFACQEPSNWGTLGGQAETKVLGCTHMLALNTALCQ